MLVTRLVVEILHEPKVCIQLLRKLENVGNLIGHGGGVTCEATVGRRLGQGLEVSCK